MKRAIKKITSRMPVSRPMTPPTLALRKVTSKTGRGVYASADVKFRGAVFGRDSLEVAEDLMAFKPTLVKRIILTIASLQGLEHNLIREEDYGKIVHEYRTHTVDGKSLSGVSKHIFDTISKRWGGDDKSVAYYGTVDATPLYIRTVADYCRMYGKEILKEPVTQRDGNQVLVADTVKFAIDWVRNNMARSGSGMVEWHPRSSNSNMNQAWKDSGDFYIHEDGSTVNHNMPITSIEVQGLAYDALHDAAELFPEEATVLLEQANVLRDKTLDYMWMPDVKYFALGTDYDAKGQLRKIKSLTANPAELLDSGFFEDLPEKERKKYVGAIVKMIFSGEFLTDAGVRSRALSQASLTSFWEYQGSYASWPKETYDIAKGLRRYGFPKLAKELENRLLNVVYKSKSYMEFIYVDKRGRVLASQPLAGKAMQGEIVLVDSHNRPEKFQAWTVSAVVAILSSRSPGKRTKIGPRTDWSLALEQKTLSMMPRVTSIKRGKALVARYPDYPYVLTQDSEPGEITIK